MDEQPKGSSPQPSKGGGSGKAIGIVIAIIIIALLAWYFTKNSSKNNTVSQTKSASDNTAAMQPTSGSQPTSLKDLMMSSSSQKCDVSFTNGNTQSQGTIYVGNGKFRGDFSATVNGTTTMSHMISDQQTSYMWVEGMATGYKMAAVANSTTTAPSQANSQAVDPNANYDYHCSNWPVDNSQFTPPTNINFTDMSAMMQTGAGAGASSGSGASAGANSSATMHAQECAACGQAGANKAQCMAALKCN